MSNELVSWDCELSMNRTAIQDVLRSIPLTAFYYLRMLPLTMSLSNHASYLSRQVPASQDVCQQNYVGFCGFCDW